MWTVRTLLMAAMFVAPFQARAQTCNGSEDTQASRSIARATSVVALQEVARKFPGCMAGGGIAEEVSGKVASVLSIHWRTSLAQVSQGTSGKEVEAFVLRNLNETDASEDLKRVLDHARHNCPAQFVRSCKRIEHAAKAALDGAG